MRVLLVTARSDRGGGPQHISDLLRGLKKIRPSWKVGVASPRTEPFGPIFRSESDYFIEIPAQTITPQVALDFSLFLKKEHIDLVHSHGLGAGLYGRLPRVPNFSSDTQPSISRVHSFHGIHNPQSFIAEVKLQVERTLAHFTDYFVCVTESERQQAVRLKIGRPEQMRIISNGIHLPKFVTPTQSRESLRIARKWKPSDFVIGSLGRLDPIKKYDVFIETLVREGGALRELLATRNQNLKCVIAGSGAENAKLQSLVKYLKCEDWIEINEFETAPADFLKGIDLYFSASSSEAQGIAVMEAMATGLPVVITKVNGHVDLIQSGVTGEFYDSQKPETFISQVKNLLLDSEHMSALGENAQQFANRHFSIEDTVLKIAQLYEEVFATRPN